MFRRPVTILSVTMLSTAAIALGLASVPAAAQSSAPALHRHRVAHHARILRRASPRIVAAAPYGVPLDEVGPEHYPYNGGEDELGPEDGVRAGQDGTPGPRDYPGTPFASTSRRGFEIEGPPIYPTLPILPVYVDPSVYR